MRCRKRLRVEWIARVAVIVGVFPAQDSAHAQDAQQWTGSWGSAQQAVCDQSQLPTRSFQGATLRETVHLSLGGSQIRLRLANLFGKQPLLISSVAVARAQPGKLGVIDRKSSVLARFKGATAVTVPPGAEVMSDNIPLSVQPLSDLAVSLMIDGAPSCATSHPGARATAFLLTGDHVTDELLTAAESFVHWYFLSAVDVSGGASNGAVAVLGDSITDGHGATTDGNDRWTDVLAACLARRKIAVLNFGIGGNRVLADGIGPSALSRFEHDALGGTGVHTVIILEAINDLGLDRLKEHPQEDHDALVNRLEMAMKGMVESAHQKGVCVLGGALTPYVGSGCGFRRSSPSWAKGIPKHGRRCAVEFASYHCVSSNLAAQIGKSGFQFEAGTPIARSLPVRSVRSDGWRLNWVACRILSMSRQQLFADAGSVCKEM